MTSILSAVSGHFTRTLVFGTFVPVAVFTSLVILLLAPLVRDRPLPVAAFGLAPGELSLAALPILVVAMTAVLHFLNVPLFRLYEGYPWQHTRLGRARARQYRRRVSAAALAQRRLIALRRSLAPDHQQRGELQDRLNQVARLQHGSFPGADLVLPTRLGNVIRCSEEYPRQQYGISAVTLWPHLAARIDRDYASALDDGKAAVDFHLNSSFLSAASGACLLAVAGVTGVHRHGPLAIGAIILIVLSLTALSYAFYLAAVGRAAAWGALVRGAFDLYRKGLLAQLGYQHEPRTIAEERAIWRAVSRQIIFRDPVDGQPLPYRTIQPPSWWDRQVARIQGWWA